MNRNSVENKWIVDEGHQITGLVHPKTKKEAKQEMQRLGISGSLHARLRFVRTNRYKNCMLGDQRVMMKLTIQKHAALLLNGDYDLVKKLSDLGIALSERQNDIIVQVDQKLTWCDTATKDELDAYDPSKDNWPS